MRKVIKNKSIPNSLNSEKTSEVREEIIQKGKYPTSKTLMLFRYKSESTYNNKYKAEDIQEKLRKIYNHKCCYCEQRVEQKHIEHYRPKSKYYWLAYSWDNLLLCCPYCNEYKSDNFPLPKKSRMITIHDFDITDIHNLSDLYDEQEKPLLINPEKEDAYPLLIFDRDGVISSNDTRVEKTINVCKLDREYLNDRRKELYEEFEKKINSRILEYRSGDKKSKIKLKGYIEDFNEDSVNSQKEYISFRKYILKHWLTKLINDINS